mgnify:CR=1 FL=1
MNRKMDRRGFLASALLTLLAAAASAVRAEGGGRDPGTGIDVGRTSRKRAAYWKELAG